QGRTGPDRAHGPTRRTGSNGSSLPRAAAAYRGPISQEQPLVRLSPAHPAHPKHRRTICSACCMLQPQQEQTKPPRPAPFPRSTAISTGSHADCQQTGWRASGRG
ncbi:hypothetical protein BC831DRAFT_443934, partial [Entophlyctis helioformis]